MVGSIITAVSGLLGTVVDKAIPDKDEANKLKAQLVMQLNNLSQEELKSATSIITAEAQGESWLQRNWRPLTMMTFLVLLLLYWFGIQPEGLAQETINKLFDLLQIGIGGYIAGRSAEKGLKIWKDK